MEQHLCGLRDVEKILKAQRERTVWGSLSLGLGPRWTRHLSMYLGWNQSSECLGLATKPVKSGHLLGLLQILLSFLACAVLSATWLGRRVCASDSSTAESTA